MPKYLLAVSDPRVKDAGGTVFISENRTGIVNTGIYNADKDAFTPCWIALVSAKLPRIPEASMAESSKKGEKTGNTVIGIAFQRKGRASL